MIKNLEVDQTVCPGCNTGFHGDHAFHGKCTCPCHQTKAVSLPPPTLPRHHYTEGRDLQRMLEAIGK